MLNILYFILGFCIVFTSVLANAQYYRYTATGAGGACNAMISDVSIDICTGASTTTSIPINYGGGTQRNFLRETISDTGAVIGTANSGYCATGSITFTDSAHCGPVACEPPKAINFSGQCVLCPSGTFVLGTDQCIPHCNYSHSYIPGEIYNPTDGQGTCVMPPCGTGQTTNEEGRCIPNCAEGQKLNVTTGACEMDCPYGTHEDNAQCVNDCPEGLVKDGETGDCIPEPICDEGTELYHGTCVLKCQTGQSRNEEGVCVEPTVECPFGQHKNEQGQCVASPVNCPQGTVWDAVAKACKTSPVTQQETGQTVTNSDGSTTTTTTITTTYSNGTGGSTSSSSTTTTTTTNNGGQDTETTFTPPNIPKYLSPEHKLNFDGVYSQARRMSEDGPIKLLHHVKEIVEWFDLEPETPVFNASVGGHSFNIDLSPFDGIAKICRFLLSCAMTIGVFWFGFRLFGII